jgi:hypothetical protein
VLIVALCVGSLVAAGPSPPAGGATRGPGAFAGLGAWVDAFDYAAAFQEAGDVVTVGPEAVPDMAALGVETLFLQAAMNDRRSPEMIIDEKLVGKFLARAHRAGMRVAAWYYPTFEDPAVDLAHVEAMVEFRRGRHAFDAIALDIEATDVRDVAERNVRVVQLVADARALVGEQPLAAVVYPAVQLEVLNQTLWPQFPYKRLARDVDVWMPMVYWTFRDGVYRDPYTYTEESIRRLRANLDDPAAVVHPIGGIGDLVRGSDYDAFLRAVRDTESVGWSIYDFDTTASSAWPRLRAGGLPPTATTTAPKGRR